MCYKSCKNVSLCRAEEGDEPVDNPPTASAGCESGTSQRSLSTPPLSSARGCLWFEGWWFWGSSGTRVFTSVRAFGGSTRSAGFSLAPPHPPLSALWRVFFARFLSRPLSSPCSAAGRLLGEDRLSITVHHGGSSSSGLDKLTPKWLTINCAQPPFPTHALL